MEKKSNNEKVILINGFSSDEAFTIMRAVKAAVNSPEDIAFCMGTASNMEWKVKDLITEVAKEHAYMHRKK